MAQSEPSRDDLIRENAKLRELLKVEHVDTCAGITIKTIPWFFSIGGFCFGVYEIAGKKTIFDFNFSIIFSFTLTGLSILYAIFERRLKKIEIKILLNS